MYLIAEILPAKTVNNIHAYVKRQNNFNRLLGLSVLGCLVYISKLYGQSRMQNKRIDALVEEVERNRTKGE